MNFDNNVHEKNGESNPGRRESAPKKVSQDEGEMHPQWSPGLLRYIQFLRQWTKRTLSSRRRVLTTVTFVITVISAYYYRSHQRRRRRLTRQNDATTLSIVPISILWKALQENQLTKVLLGSQSIRFQSSNTSGAQWNQVQLPPQHSVLHKELVARLTSMKDVDLSILPETDWNTVTTLLFAAIPFCYLAFVYRLMTTMQQTPPTENETDASMLLRPQSSERPVTFADVAGLDAAVADLRDLLRLLQADRQNGATLPRGILLQGPPGTGKTLLARALAHAWPGPFYHASASSFVEVYVGRGAARVRALFRQARRAESESRGIVPFLQKYWSSTGSPAREFTSSHSCAIVFIDELDALAKARSSTAFGGNDEREQTLNQLLTEMDGFYASNVIVIGATNRPDVLDPAIVRRFDRTINVGLPDAAGRTAILQLHARHLPLDAAIDWTRLAELTTGRSGSDLRHMVNDAALYAGRRTDPFVVTQHDLEAAIQRRRPAPHC
jgi:ATP-dependent Zn protease